MDCSPRLAELVLHLTGCTPPAAVAAVDAATDDAPQSIDDALAIVAKAMCSIQRVDLRATTSPVDLRESQQVRSQ
jgi:hydroxymethylpyrimidine/phosphomethylpyrimidine kinase